MAAPRPWAAQPAWASRSGAPGGGRGVSLGPVPGGPHTHASSGNTLISSCPGRESHRGGDRGARHGGWAGRCILPPPTPSPSPGVPRVTCWRGATVSASQNPHHHHHHHPPPPGPAARWRTSSWPAWPPAAPSASPTPHPACPHSALARAARRRLPHSRHVSRRQAGVLLRVARGAPGWAGGRRWGVGAGGVRPTGDVRKVKDVQRCPGVLRVLRVLRTCPGPTLTRLPLWPSCEGTRYVTVAGDL